MTTYSFSTISDPNAGSEGTIVTGVNASGAESGARHGADRLDQLWVADLTYIRLLEEFAYLTVVRDAFGRRMVGWALETYLEARLAVAALAMALKARCPAPDSLIPHDQTHPTP